MPFSSRHISSLDGLRGIAFLMVFFRHFGLSTHATGVLVRSALTLSSGGWMGVDLFFVLSGFLITGILLDTREFPEYFRNFYARRALRIFPLYYTVLALLLILTPWLHLKWRAGHLAYLFYAGNLAYNLDPSLSLVQPAVSMLHLWSLAVEEQFYLVWPLVVLVVASRRRLAWVCVWLSCGGLILRALLLLWLPLGTGYEWCYAQLPTHMDGLLYGALASLWVRSTPSDRLRSGVRIGFSCAVVALLAVLAVSGMDFHSMPMVLIGFPALAATCTGVVTAALRPGSVVNRIGTLAPLRFVGRYSYGMYIYHFLFSPVLGGILPWLQARLGSVLLGGVCFVVLMFAGTMLAAVASYELYEKQWLRWKGRFAYRPTAELAG